MSVVLHYSASSCFTWCLVDSLYLYFNHTNSAHPLRKNVYYLLFGWGEFSFSIVKTRTRRVDNTCSRDLSFMWFWGARGLGANELLARCFPYDQARLVLNLSDLPSPQIKNLVCKRTWHGLMEGELEWIK